MGVETRLGEIAVVGLVIYLHGEVAVGREQIADVEIADERRACRGCFVAVAELSVDEQAVVEQAAAEESFVLRVVTTFVAGGDVGTEIPVVALYHRTEQGVYLSADGA